MKASIMIIVPTDRKNYKNVDKKMQQSQESSRNVKEETTKISETLQRYT